MYLHTVTIYEQICASKASGQKQLAVLIDPDKWDADRIPDMLEVAHQAEVDMFFVGGSLLLDTNFQQIVKQIKALSHLPVVLFPGDQYQICDAADAILFLSLISGRNPELLIGKHVQAAPLLKQSSLEIISTGYMLIDSGNYTTAHYISNALPIPHAKPEIAMCTAMAGEMLGMKMMYMDGGSGAQRPISQDMIHAVSEQVACPLIVGGGIKDPETAFFKAKAGADVLVVGNIIEDEPKKVIDLAAAIHSVSVSL